MVSEEISSKSGTRRLVALPCTYSVRSSNKQHRSMDGLAKSPALSTHAPLTTSSLMQLAPGEAIQVLLCALHSVRVSCYFPGGLEFSLFMKRRVQALNKHFPQHCWRLCFLVLLLTSIGTGCDWLFRRSSIFLRTTQPQCFKTDSI